MKAHLIEIDSQKKHLASFKQIEQHCFLNNFHFHDLFEMNHIVEGHGKRIVGDNISNFSKGDFILIAPNLPHLWASDPICYGSKTLAPAKAIVTYFSPSFLVKLSEDNQYAFKVQELLKNAKRGMQFYGYTQEIIAEKLLPIINRKPLEKIIIFLDIINILINSNEYEFLTSVGYNHAYTHNDLDTNRMNDVYQYLFQNFTEPVYLTNIASVANLTPQAFCHFFKKKTRKTLTEFLNELRIGHACKLLQDQELTIVDICFQSGYQNMSHFNNSFKRITKQTPTEFRKNCINLLSSRA
ncbi:AraC family transcriptional regulator [Arachidicoccus sp.]|uniref:AraC family transcriptional regulator n=1 Tax=Arachidicoccus sp. TaxID=1872624 RepID=UPI003D1F2ED9